MACQFTFMKGNTLSYNGKYRIRWISSNSIFIHLDSF